MPSWRSMVASLATALIACSTPTSREAGHHDAFVTRDAWRVPDDIYVPHDSWAPPQDTGPPDTGPPDAWQWHCVPTLAPSAPLPDAVIGTSAQQLTLRSVVRMPVTFEVCADATCRAPIRSMSATTLSATVSPPLAEGRYFWRARDASSALTAPWPFRVAATGVRSGRRPVDVNGDGLADVLFEDRTETRMWLGALGAPPFELPPARHYGSPFLHARDVNGDGVSDIAFSFGTYLGFLFGDPCPPFSLSNVDTAHLSAVMTDLGDADGDGLDDVLVSTAGSPGCTLIAYYGEHTSPGTRSHTIGTACVAAAAALADDWTGDGLPDVVVGVENIGGVGLVRVYSAAPSSSGAPFLVIAGAAGSADFGMSVIDAGDLDGDGTREIAVAQTSPSVVTFFDTAGMLVWSIAVPGIDRFHGQLAALGDFDLDGYDDLAIGTVGAVYVAFGGLAAPTLVRLTGGGSYAVTAPGDVDGDGAPDLLLVIGPSVVLYRGGTRTPRELARLVPGP